MFQYLDPITGYSGYWSKEGCFVDKVFDGNIRCHCNHLTNFALLMDVSQTHQNPLQLQIITWIGCGLSIIGLCLTLIARFALR